MRKPVRKRLVIVSLASVAAMAATGAAAQTSAAAAIWGTQGADCKAARVEAEPWKNTAYSPECRARFVLRRLHTVAEKLDFLDPPPSKGKPAGPTVAKKLGLPQIRSSDGPAGVARVGHATALPSPLAVAASFDPNVAKRYGDVLGREARAAGLGLIGGPAMDTARTWHFGRLSESFGEDPFLTASMVALQIRAIQAHGVVATMKHFAVYTQESGRVGDQPSGSAPAIDNRVSEKGLREIYLPPFEAAVKQGHVGAVMCSFPRIDGVYACQNAHLFDILKREWGFDGFVEPDFPSAQRSIVPAIMAGLDRGSARPNRFDAALAGQRTLREAVAQGIVPEARLDDMMLRRLIPYFRVGTFDDPPVKTGPDVSTPEDRAAAARILEAGSVLLKNAGGVLPFDKDVHSIAVIGTQATDKAVAVEQGSAYVEPVHLVAPLAAIRARARKGTRVTFAAGTLGLGPLPSPPAGAFARPSGEPGFRAEYFANPNLDFSGAPLAVRTVADPSVAKAPAVAGLPGDNAWSVRYTARFTPQVSGPQLFSLDGSGTARLLVDGKRVAGFAWSDFSSVSFARVPLPAGRPVTVEIDYTPRSALREKRVKMMGVTMGLTLKFGYAPPNDLIAKAQAAARKADVAVVFAGERVGEGMDRETLSLQGDQDALIEAVAAANPNTVVVLSTGGAVAMPWRGNVRAVLETWMPGDAFGSGVAAMLFGDREPGGRLPVTFPANAAQGPGTHTYEWPGTTEPGTGRLENAWYDEGVLVGYRYWDAHKQQPLFPFGYGLGYGDVAMTGLGVSDGNDGAKVVRVRVRNDGARAASAVPEVYLGFPAAAHEPPKQLEGFAKVALKPGEEREVAIRLPPEAFRYWDAGKASWASGGSYQVMVGTSSRDIVWHGTVGVRASTRE